MFIVNENKFIEIRQNPFEDFYYSFYPIKYENEKKFPLLVKATLFIQFDKSILTKFQYPDDKNQYYKIKGTGNDGFVYFIEEKKYKTFSSEKLLKLYNVLKNSGAFYKKNKLVDSKLAAYLTNYTVFLVEKNDFIKVGVIIEIE